MKNGRKGPRRLLCIVLDNSSRSERMRGREAEVCAKGIKNVPIKALQSLKHLSIILVRALVGIVQLARTPDCGSGGRRFESDYPPQRTLKKEVPASHKDAG